MNGELRALTHFKKLLSSRVGILVISPGYVWAVVPFTLLVVLASSAGGYELSEQAQAPHKHESRNVPR